MHSTKIVMGRGSVSTRGGQRRILKKAPDLLTYIEKAVKSGTYRSTREIEEMNQKLSDNPVDMKRLRWNLHRGSSIQDYPVEYEIMSLNPPTPFKPYMPVKHEQKMVNEYIQKHRPSDKLAQKYLNRYRQQQQESGPASAEEYYRRLLGVNRVPKVDSAMGNKSAAVNKAYAFAVKQHHIMRTENLSEAEALDKVEQLLQEEDREERHGSREVVETLKRNPPSRHGQRPMGQPFVSKEPASATAATRDQEEKMDIDSGDYISLLYSNDHRAYEGMISWAQRLSAVPYARWTVGASVALDHWIAKRVLGLSEETWLSLLEGEDHRLLSRGRDIVAARHALFPETILDGDQEEAERMAEEEEAEDDIDQLLATLGGWNKDGTSGKGQKSNSAFDWKVDEEDGEIDDRVLKLADQLQEWRARNMETKYDDWSEEQKLEFMSWLESYVKALAPDASQGRVDLDATRQNLLAIGPQTAEDATNFWESIRDQTAAEVFLQEMLDAGLPEKPTEMQRIFWEMPYEKQLERLINLGTIRELADEYTKPTDRQKFITRFGDYLLEGVELDHLVVDPNGPVSGDDLGDRLARQWNVTKDDRFRIERIPYGDDGFGTDASKRARDMYRAWNLLKAGRAHYEEKLFQQGLLGLQYEAEDKKKEEK